MVPNEIDRSGEAPSPAPLARRIGANLLDSGLGLLVIYVGVLPIKFAYAQGFGDIYLALYQSFVIGWVVLKDAWWPGQSLGKKVAHIIIVTPETGRPAPRPRCVGRQAIFATLLIAISLPAYLSSSHEALVVRLAILAGVLSAVAPIRLITIFFSDGSFLSEGKIPLVIMLAVMVIEGLLVYLRPDRRRLVDLLAGTKVVDDRRPLPS